MNSHRKSSIVKSDLLFIFSSIITLMLLQSVFRAMLLWRNSELSMAIPFSELTDSFLVGMRFDLIVIAYVMLPVFVMLLHPRGVNRRMAIVWLTIVGTVLTFFAVLELDFYHEFYVRLNSLVFQYVREDSSTVMSMIWYGFPVVRYLILITVIVGFLYWILNDINQHLPENGDRETHYAIRFGVFVLVIMMMIVAARGTLRQGPPLRWGDAFHSEYLFANHLALNGTYTLTKAFIADLKQSDKNIWLDKMPQEDATLQIQQLLLTDNDTLIDPDYSPVLRTYHAGQGLVTDNNKPLNVVLILMESFSAEFIGSMGHEYGITPEFDQLTKKGLLFDNFFSNGTHTHQGMFASAACFPNLPGYEYLMQQPQGDTNFSGILKLVNDREYQSIYVYNGDFSWDNQRGFFGGLGMQKFVGRHDYIDPIFSDPTWGVSDQDMFNRAVQELDNMPKAQPFFAFIQSLSNHTPYALPDPLPVEAVANHGSLNEHLTAMHYSDWALGAFFRQIENADYFNDTLFIIVGDHGFSTTEQLTDMDLARFHVPLLIIGPGVVNNYGNTSPVVGSQVDIAPTIAGLLGGESIHSCWGRDLLNIKDSGFAMIKPSGGDQTTAYIEGNFALVKQPGVAEKLYHYDFGEKNKVEKIDDNPSRLKQMNHKLEAYIQAATSNLLHGTVGENPN